MVFFPTIAPIFFGQTTIQGCIHNTDFEEKMESISPTHLKWAKLIKEHITQQENDNDDVITITDCLSKKSRIADNSKFATIGFFEAYVLNSCFFFVFNLSNQEKWGVHQDRLREFFVGNLSPVPQAQFQPSPSSSSWQQQPSQQQQPLQQHQHNHQQTPPTGPPDPAQYFYLMVILQQLSEKFWVLLISPRPSLLSQGLTSVVRAMQNSTITCSSSFLLAEIQTYLPLGCLLRLAFLSIRKQ
jgi:hypothetical protein